MGTFRVRVRLTGPGGQAEDTELLVDTGASVTVVPTPLAGRLGLTPKWTQTVVIAGGRRETWPITEVRLAIDGREITTPCFIAPDGPALLGAVALESLFLAVDPVAKRLTPVEGIIG